MEKNGPLAGLESALGPGTAALERKALAVAKLHSPPLNDTFGSAPNLLRVQVSWGGCNYLPGTLLNNAAKAGGGGGMGSHAQLRSKRPWPRGCGFQSHGP